MKAFLLSLALSSIACAGALAAPAKAPAKLGEGRCFDLKQKVLHDVRDAQAGTALDRRIDQLAKQCDQPQLAHLLRKALQRRVASAR
jgi:hypothetical protein